MDERAIAGLVSSGTEPVTLEELPGETRNGIWRRTLRSRRGWIGVTLLVLVSSVAAIGPFVMPHDPAEVVGLSYLPPNGSHLLGTDQLGRDVLSRVLDGGWLLLISALVATLIAYAVGGSIGMLAGYRRARALDVTASSVADIFIAVPPIIMALGLLTTLGTGVVVTTAAIALVQAPRIMRLVRTFTISIRSNEYVEAAVARGESTASILLREIAPNLRSLVLADFGIRLCWSFIMYASLSFLGLGQPPPAADWGLMISENRVGLTLQPWSVLAPILCISVLTVGVNMAAEAVSDSIGRSGGEA
ncbi:ABC transporter permease [Nocardioides sp.]|uniref:ABC transporter permease n=1 Tax=Nocardioides sp. TaxID=35761 RepID=UPI003D0F767B